MWSGCPRVFEQASHLSSKCQTSKTSKLSFFVVQSRVRFPTTSLLFGQTSCSTAVRGALISRNRSRVPREVDNRLAPVTRSHFNPVPAAWLAPVCAVRG